MKVVFLEDVPKVAKAGETRDVADGYARNFLLPRKLAVLLDAQTARTLEAQLRKRVHLKAQTETEIAELGKELEGKEIVLKAKAGAEGRLYGSVTSADIAKELTQSLGKEIDKRKIELVEPVRQLGSYEVVVRLSKDILPKIKVTVIVEEKK